jgi:hypothetical protein
LQGQSGHSCAANGSVVWSCRKMTLSHGKD